MESWDSRSVDLIGRSCDAHAAPPLKLNEFFAYAFERRLMHGPVHDSHNANAWQGHLAKHVCSRIASGRADAIVRPFAGLPNEPCHRWPEKRDGGCRCCLRTLV